MNTQEQFEKAYAEAHDMPLETFKEYRMGDTYRLPMIAKCWRFWQMAIEKPSALIAQLQSELTARDEEIDALRSRLQQSNSAGQPAGEGV